MTYANGVPEASRQHSGCERQVECLLGIRGGQPYTIGAGSPTAPEVVVHAGSRQRGRGLRTRRDRTAASRVGTRRSQPLCRLWGCLYGCATESLFQLLDGFPPGQHESRSTTISAVVHIQTR
jgi:hypothetical protein